MARERSALHGEPLTPDEILSSAARLLRSGVGLEPFVAALDDETRRRLIPAMAREIAKSLPEFTGFTRQPLEVVSMASVYAGLRHQVQEGSYLKTRTVPLALGGGGVS